MSLVLALSLPGVARAGDPEHCTVGDVRSVLQTFGGASRVLIGVSGGQSPSAVRVGARLCSFRLFTASGESIVTPPDPEDPDDPGLIEFVDPICFCEHDHFLGGNTRRFQSREDAVEGQASWEVGVSWEGELLDGTSVPATDLELLQTPVEVWLSTGFEAWFQVGALLGPLAPGSYTSLLSENTGDADVLLHVEVLPHAIAHAGGPAPGGLDGSVVCP